MRSYLAILRGAVMEGMTYRIGFFFILFGNLIYLCVAYFLWHSIYENTTVIHGLTFNDTFIYVALGGAVFVLLKTYADWQISHEIEDGTISVYLTKPIDYELYSMFVSLGSVITTLVVISIPTLFVLIFIFKVTFVLGPGLLLFPLSLLLAFLISFCFDYVIGLVAFYTESIWGISTTKEILISILAGALIPLQFFPDAIQKILLVLPFQAIYYTPLMMVTRPNQGLGTLLSMLGVQVFWVVALFILTRLFYNQAIKVLRVAGG
jgi:ABC-2 type transport system permease protein